MWKSGRGPEGNLSALWELGRVKGVVLVLSGTQGLAFLLCYISQQVELPSAAGWLWWETLFHVLQRHGLSTHTSSSTCFSSRVVLRKISWLIENTSIVSYHNTTPRESALRSADRKNIRAPHGVGPVVLIKERQGGCCGLRRACVRQKWHDKPLRPLFPPLGGWWGQSSSLGKEAESSSFIIDLLTAAVKHPHFSQTGAKESVMEN